MAAPVFFVKNKDGKLCLVQDYHALNAMTMKNKYLLPLILELIASSMESSTLKLDTQWSFNNVWLKKGDKWKAAFWTNCWWVPHLSSYVFLQLAYVSQVYE